MIGHLIIHDVTAKEAEIIVKNLNKEADWWPQKEMNNFDNAALISIGKHPSTFHQPRDIKHFKKSQSFKTGDEKNEKI